jgi:hypothetical protein
MLQSAYHTLRGGRELPPGLYKRLRSYAIAHRDDPRGYLLLGHHNVRRGHLTDAINNYQRAYDADNEAKRDPRMARDLVVLVASNVVGYRASRAVARIYGREALPLIEAALASSDLSDPARRRYERLRDTVQNQR